MGTPGRGTSAEPCKGPWGPAQPPCSASSPLPQGILPRARSSSRAWPPGASAPAPGCRPCPSPCGVQRVAGRLTCIADLFEAEQAEDAVVELHLLAVALVHLIQDLHQLVACLGWVGTGGLVHRQLVKRAMPRAADALVLALRHPGEAVSTVVTPAHARWPSQGAPPPSPAHANWSLDKYPVCRPREGVRAQECLGRSRACVNCGCAYHLHPPGWAPHGGPEPCIAPLQGGSVAWPPRGLGNQCPLTPIQSPWAGHTLLAQEHQGQAPRKKSPHGHEEPWRTRVTPEAAGCRSKPRLWGLLPVPAASH